MDLTGKIVTCRHDPKTVANKHEAWPGTVTRSGLRTERPAKKGQGVAWVEA